MQISPVGVLICACLLLLGYVLRAPIVVALFASLAFGSTAIGALPALGGATPLLFAPMAGLLIASTLARRGVRGDLALVFSLHWTPMVVVALLLYGIASAVIMPRLFAGETTAFIAGRSRVMETMLAPVSGNITQSCYFAIGILTFLALSALLVRGKHLEAVKTGFFTFGTVHATFGVLDLFGKLSGAGDILWPIRTAAYSMLIEVQVEGFWRITGSYPEASTFAGGTLIALAFSFSYWRSTGSRCAFALAALLTLLLLLSTSTTGYTGLAVLSLVLSLSLLLGVVRGRFASRDALVLVLAVLALTVALAVLMLDEHLLDPVVRMMQTTVFEKSVSASAEERFYWNYKSLMAFLDTGGLGIGLGSSRASSWVIAVLSQLGVVGAALLALLVFQILRRPYRAKPASEDAELAALCKGARAAGFAIIVPMTIAGGLADPGVIFFIVLATLFVGQARLAQSESRSMSPSTEWVLSAR
jgi:hypothetical protein